MRHDRHLQLILLLHLLHYIRRSVTYPLGAHSLCFALLITSAIYTLQKPDGDAQACSQLLDTGVISREHLQCSVWTAQCDICKPHDMWIVKDVKSNSVLITHVKTLSHASCSCPWASPKQHETAS